MVKYNTPYPKQAPWFIYGPYLAPNGNWYFGYVVANGQLAMSSDKIPGFTSQEAAKSAFTKLDHGLDHSSATE